MFIILSFLLKKVFPTRLKEAPKTRFVETVKPRIVEFDDGSILISLS